MQLFKAQFLRLIKWSEGVFKTDMTYLARNGFWLTIGQFVALASSFILSIVFANTLPKEVYGNYKFILSATGILGAMSLTGLGTVVTQAVAGGKDGILNRAIRTQLKWSSIVFIAALGIGIYYFLNGNHGLFYAFIIAGLAAPIINAYGLYGSFLTGKKDFKSNTLYWSITQIISVALLIIISITTKNALALIFTYFASSALMSFFFYRHIIRTRTFNAEEDDSLITYGIHISAMNVFGTIANQLDKILVFHYLGALNLAVYSFSLALPEQIKGSFKNLFNLALPKYASVDHIHMRKSIIKKIWQLTSYTILLVIAYILVAPFIYKLFFPKYLDSVWYSQIYALGLIAIPAISLFGTYFQLRKKTDVLYKLSIISNIITIALTYVLISNYGLKGAVIENGISWMVIVICYCYFFMQEKRSEMAA